MGFLDFLKKDKAAPPLPKPVGFSNAELEDIGKRIGAPAPIAPPPSDDDDFENIPIPPKSMQDPDFLEGASDDVTMGTQAERDDAMAMQAPPPVPPSPMPKLDMPPAPMPRQDMPPALPPEMIKKPAPPEPKPELPDFSDEEIAALLTPPKAEQAAPMPAPPMPPEPKALPRRPKIEYAEQETHDDVPPLQAHPAFTALQPAMFLSSESYFAIADSIAETRRKLRQNDEVLKEAELRHEKGDEQFARFADEVNAVQERLMDLDAALFEE